MRSPESGLIGLERRPVDGLTAAAEVGVHLAQVERQLDDAAVAAAEMKRAVEPTA